MPETLVMEMAEAQYHALLHKVAEEVGVQSACVSAYWVVAVVVAVTVAVVVVAAVVLVGEGAVQGGSCDTPRHVPFHHLFYSWCRRCRTHFSFLFAHHKLLLLGTRDSPSSPLT